MRLESIRVRDLGPFADFSVDLTTLPEEAKLVAVVGPNGAGKSTLLELFTGGALFRECPTRGSLTALATSRAAVLEATVVNGSRWTIRHTVDGVSRKGESVVLCADGRPATSSAKVMEFDAFAASHFPPPEVLYSSTVAVQGSGGFLELKAGDRKAVLLRVLGVERLEELAKAARERVRGASAACETLQSRIADEERRGGDVEEAERAIVRAKASAAERSVELRRAEEALAVARELAKDSALARKVYEDAVAARRTLRSSVEAKAGEVTTLKRKVANNRAVLDEAEAIREAVRVRDETDVGAVDKEALDWKTKADTALLEIASLRREAKSLDGLAADLQARRDQLRAAVAQEPTILLAVEELPGARETAEQKRRRVEELEAEVAKLRGERLAVADERIGALRGALDTIRDDAEEGASASTLGSDAARALSEDDARVERATRLPVELGCAESELRECRVSLDRADARVRILESSAALADRLEADNAALADVDAKLADLEARQASIAEQVDGLLPQADAHHAKSKEASARARALRDHLETLRPLLEKEKPLQSATARLEELEPQLAKLRADLQEEQERLASTPEPQPPEQAPDLWRLDDQVSLARDDVQAAARAVGAAEGALEQARASQAALGGLREQLADAQAELADWTRLADDLGRDGLQAAMIDAAGPELAALTNDLLHRTVGSRWTVTFDTQRASADGKKLVEGLDVRVIDTERGRDAQAESLSGGEKVLVGEAVSLALSMIACRRAGIERPTLVRDESGAALDPVNSRHYVAMLRRAADLVGADRVLVVSHSPEVQELCDERIEVGNA